MITGGLAAIIYGEPRLTNDVDIVMRLEPEAAELLIEAFPAPAGRREPLDRTHRVCHPPETAVLSHGIIRPTPQ